MEHDKFAEFVTVLAVGMAFAAGVWLSVHYLENDTALGIALIVLAVAAVIAWQYLRKHFGRQ